MDEVYSESEFLVTTDECRENTQWVVKCRF